MSELYLWFTAGAAFLASMAGGFLYLKGLRKNGFLIQAANGFSGGFIISIALVHLFPEAALDRNYTYALLGFGLFYLIEALTKGSTCSDERCQEEHHERGYLAFSGLSFHSLVDGLAMGFGFGASQKLGLLIGLAIFLHKAPMGFTLANILSGKGQKTKKIEKMLFIFSLFTPLGAIIGGYAIWGSQGYLPSALAFSGGTFLHISISELLPQAHKKNRVIFICVLLGILFGFLTRLLGH